VDEKLNRRDAKLKINAMINVVTTVPLSLTPRFSGVLAANGERKTVSTVFRAVEGRGQ
jgi:hypothetical protein